MDSESGSSERQSIYQSVVDDGHGGWGYSHHIGRSLYQPSKDKISSSNSQVITALEIASSHKRPIDAIPSFSLEPTAELKTVPRPMTVGPLYEHRQTYTTSDQATTARSAVVTRAVAPATVAVDSTAQLTSRPDSKERSEGDRAGALGAAVMSIDELERYSRRFTHAQYWQAYLKVMKTLGGDDALLLCTTVCDRLGVKLDTIAETWEATPVGDVQQCKYQLVQWIREKIASSASIGTSSAVSGINPTQAANIQPRSSESLAQLPLVKQPMTIANIKAILNQAGAPASADPTVVIVTKLSTYKQAVHALEVVRRRSEQNRRAYEARKSGIKPQVLEESQEPQEPSRSLQFEIVGYLADT